MDMYNLLIEDHKKVRKLFEKALADKENIDKEIVDQICEELLLHMEKEEKFLYPVILEIKELEDMAKEAIEEHKEGKTCIKALQGGKLSKAKYIVKVEVLKLEIEHHVEEEETEMFPKLKKLLPKEQAAEIAEKMEELKAKKAGKVPVASR